MPAGLSCPGGIGLTTALGILPGGWVVVGSLPTTSGGALPSLQPAGCLIVLRRRRRDDDPRGGRRAERPLGMTLAPNGDVVVVNGNNGNVVEISPAGTQLFTKTLIKNGAGDLFGITTPAGGLLAVNDVKNVIDIYRP